MKTKVLLISPAEAFTQEDYGGRPASPDLGLAYIRGFLRKNCDSEISIIEMFPSSSPVKIIEKTVAKFHPDIVGLTAKTFNILTAYKIAKAIKQMRPAVVTVLGGAHGTALPEFTLNECKHIDAVVRGEGEITMKEIVERFSNGIRGEELFWKVKGLTYRTSKHDLIHNDNCDLITGLDIIPFTDFSIYDLSSYSKVYNHRTHRYDLRFPIQSSRGCPYQCTFCAPQPHKLRYRSVPNVISEIKLISEQYNASHIYFEDSIFGINKKWVEEFCQEFVRLALHKRISWGFETRVEMVQDNTMLKVVKEAGCDYISFGIESANENVLHHAKKHFTKEQAYKAVKLAKETGIKFVNGNFIFGLPFETKESINETIEFIQESSLDFAGAGIVDIYPGTELYEMVEQGAGGIRWLPGMRNNWTSYSRRTCQTVVNGLTEHDLLNASNYVTQLYQQPLIKLLTVDNFKRGLNTLLRDPFAIKRLPKRLVRSRYVK